MADRRTLNVEKLASGGDGIAFSNGQVVFIPFSIPGETLLCDITEVNADFLRAAPLEILNASPGRIEAPCPLFGRCGGCSLQHIKYSRQLELKGQMFAESLARTAKLPGQEFSLLASEPYAYRNRVELHVTADQGFGYMEGASDRALRAPGCPIAVKPISDWLKTQNRKSKPAKELQARIGPKERFVVFAQSSPPAIEGLDAKAQALVGGRRYRFPLSHFFQSNLAMTELLVDKALLGLSGTRALDLYAGAGLFAAGLAESFSEVTLIESDAQSLEAARENVRAGKARFVPTEVEEWLRAESARSRRGQGGSFDWVVADPPRSGLSAATRTWLKTAPIGGLSYVSCNHATMARDLGDLCSSGWRIESLDVFDFYPQTGHIEALARLAPPKALSRGG
ncbi:MAG: TRAM domain-containing protein [Spirochaetales bacterium]|nr:TRAM domain-containing protein [Spirochaetales bacterium]